MVPHDPSNGSGGAYPGDEIARITVPGFGNHTLYLMCRQNYTPERAWPLMLAMHGTAGYPGAAPAAARQVRDDWSTIADSGGFIVLAPVASGSNGSWEPDIDIPVIFAAIDDTMARYNIEQTRMNMWGYSAGGHLAHGLALNHTDFFTAYGVSAGALTQYACTDDGSPPPSCSELLDNAEPKIPVDIHIGVVDPLYLYYGANQDAARFAGRRLDSGTGPVLATVRRWTHVHDRAARRDLDEYLPVCAGTLEAVRSALRASSGRSRLWARLVRSQVEPR